MQLIVLDNTKKMSNYERADKNGNHESQYCKKYCQVSTVFVKNFCSVASAPDDLTARTFEITSANCPFNLLLDLASFFVNFAIGLDP